MNDIIIIGGGPAGLTAAIYSSRGGMNTVLFEQFYPGGQMSSTHLIENYPGIESVSGMELAITMEKQAKSFGVSIVNEEVTSLELDSVNKLVKTPNNSYMSKTVILAMGASPKGLGVPGEDRFRGSGVSYCATCDGGFFRNKTTAVIGGGNTAVEDAIYLSKLCKKVYLVHRRDSLRAEKALQDAALSSGIEFIWNSVVDEIMGTENVENIVLKNIRTEETSNLAVDGVFVAVGTAPNSKIVRGLVDMNEYGYIHTDENMLTNMFGVYAVGDVRDKPIRQVVAAASDGATAAQAAVRYINEHQWA